MLLLQVQWCGNILKRLRESRIDIRKLRGVKIAVIGKGTGAKLERLGFMQT